MGAVTRTTFAAFLTLAGCGSDPTPPPTTEGKVTSAVGLHVEARSNGGETQIIVNPGDSSMALLLAGGDQLLFAEAGGPEVALVLAEPDRYVGQIVTPGTDFELTFARPGGQRFTSQLALPPPFALWVPPEDTPRSAPIVLTWDADATSPARIEVSGPCLQSISRSLEQDVGTYTLQPADLFVTDGAGSCALTAMITRDAGKLTPAPELGPTTGLLEQIREASFTTVP
jgi:hypothetical protein